MEYNATDDWNANYQLESLDSIVCSRTIENVPMVEVKKTLFKWWNFLKPGGLLQIDILDMARVLENLTLHGIIDLYKNTNRVWLSAANLVELLTESGFEQFSTSFQDNAVTRVQCKKVDLYTVDRMYAGEITILPGETVLEVGPGTSPFKSVTRYFDITKEYESYLDGKPLDIGNVESMPYKDKEFDVAIASHVVEHTEHPDRAITELQRVAKRGYIEVPSAAKDWLLQHGHIHDKWQITKSSDTLVFVAMTPDRVRFLNDQAERNQMARAVQYPGVDNYTQFALRRAFWNSNQFLNLVACWDESHPVKYVVIP